MVLAAGGLSLRPFDGNHELSPPICRLHFLLPESFFLPHEHSTSILESGRTTRNSELATWNAQSFFKVCSKSTWFIHSQELSADGKSRIQKKVPEVLKVITKRLFILLKRSPRNPPRVLYEREPVQKLELSPAPYPLPPGERVIIPK
jgi:hypothetical protein